MKRKLFITSLLLLISFTAGYNFHTVIVPTDPWEELDWDLFTEALINTESKGKEDAIGDSGKAVGVLQIWPIAVREANRLAGTSYSYDDRYSKEKSIEIFNVIQGHYNPKHDPVKALRVWNKKHPQSYKDKTFSKYEELFYEAHGTHRMAPLFKKNV